MNEVSPALAALIIAICSQLIILAPVAFLAIRTWLQVKTNSMELRNRPTHQQVSDRLDVKVQQLLAQNGTDKDTIGAGKP